MAITGYEEEARMLAQATLLPGSESGGFGQNDVASPVFLAWTKQERAGELLQAALASLCPIALRALEVTGRPAPAALDALVSAIRAASEGETPSTPPSAAPEALARMLRTRVYG
jgi:histidine ammonia-lyase